MNPQVAGGRKGGRSRARKLSAKKRSEIARLGGHARAAKARALPEDVEVGWEPAEGKRPGMWVAHVASVPGAYGLGKTEDRARSDLRESLKELESYHHEAGKK